MATFKADLKEIVKLRLFLQNAPKKVRKASAEFLNNLAFGSRRAALKELDRTMTIRSPGFIRGSVRVQKTRAGTSIVQQMSVMGSIRRARFSGFEEQEFGTDTKRKRVQTTAARGGKWGRRVAPRFRLKPGAKVLKPQDRKLKANQIIPFLQIISREKYRKPFLLPKAHKKLQKGIFNLKGRRIQRLHALKAKQPKTNRWHSNAVDRYLSRRRLRLEWQKSMNWVFKK